MGGGGSVPRNCIDICMENFVTEKGDFIKLKLYKFMLFVIR